MALTQPLCAGLPAAERAPAAPKSPRASLTPSYHVTLVLGGESHRLEPDGPFEWLHCDFRKEPARAAGSARGSPSRPRCSAGAAAADAHSAGLARLARGTGIGVTLSSLLCNRSFSMFVDCTTRRGFRGTVTETMHLLFDQSWVGGTTVVLEPPSRLQLTGPPTEVSATVGLLQPFIRNGREILFYLEFFEVVKSTPHSPE